MIFLFHGNNLVASREALRQLLKQYTAASVFSLKSDITFGQFQEVCEPGVLFGGVRLVLVEVFLKEVSRRPTALLNAEPLPAYLKNKPENTHVALWFDEELPALHPLLRALTGEKMARIFCTNLHAPNIFSFLEELANRHHLAALRQFCSWQRMEINNVYLLTMMAWQWRRLLAFFYGTPLGKIAPFVRAKLARQVKNFSEEELLGFYEELAVLDARSKSGEADLSLGLFRLVERITGARS